MVQDPSSDRSVGERMFVALCGLSVFATALGVGRHVVEAIADGLPEDGLVSARLATVPASVWLFATLHLLCAVGSVGVGYLLLSLSYPRRHLAREARANPAAAIQAGSHLLGAMIVTAVSWGGTDAGSLLVSATFCALGWVAMIAIAAAHRLVTRYRDHEEIAAGNTAAAVSASGLGLAVAIVVAHAIQGQFLGWRHSLIAFGEGLVWVVALYPLRQIVLARLIMRLHPRQLDLAIAERRDHYLAAVEAVCYLLTALSLSAGG